MADKQTSSAEMNRRIRGASRSTTAEVKTLPAGHQAMGAFIRKGARRNVTAPDPEEEQAP